MQNSNRYTVVLGVIGADCHAVGNKILYTFLSAQGVRVVNLGVMVSQDEFILAAKEHHADAILVSSIYGHGEIDCQGFRKNCEREKLFGIILYVGGNLVIGKQAFSEVAERFEQMGFDRVFPPTADLFDMVNLLKQDIDAQRQGMLGHNSIVAARDRASDQVGQSANRVVPSTDIAPTPASAISIEGRSGEPTRKLTPGRIRI